MLQRIAILTILITSIAHSQKLHYIMEDLEVLSKEGSHKEFLEHAHDIRPTKRSTRWKSLLFKVSKAFISEQIAKGDFSKENFDYAESLAHWPTLKNNELFSLEKTKYSLRSIDHCYKNVSPVGECHRRLDKFWNSSKKYVDRPDISFRLGSYLAPFKTSRELWTYFKIVASSKMAIFYCSKPVLQKTILAIATEQVDLNSPRAKSKLYSIANGECWEKIAPTLQKSIVSKNKIQSDYAFALLETLGKIKEEDKDLYLTYYLLQNPSVGDTFNIAWNHIKEIAQDYKRRIKVIKSLKNFDPLPGKTFAIDDPKKKEILVDLIYKSIPEYLDYYATICTNYLQGKGIFPNGNPTMECRELMAHQKSKKWISPHVKSKFDSIKL